MARQKKLIIIPKLLKLDITDKRQGFTVLLIGIAIVLASAWLADWYKWGDLWVYWILGMGVIVGILNIFHDEGILFLITGLTLTFMLNLLLNLMLIPVWAVTSFSAVIYLLSAATVIVTLKVLYALATK